MYKIKQYVVQDCLNSSYIFYGIYSLLTMHVCFSIRYIMLFMEVEEQMSVCQYTKIYL